MRLIFKILLYTLVILSSNLYAQKPLTTTGLNIGDHVPDLIFKNTENFSENQQRISDFKGKLLILDFWATTCGSCLAAMPKMDSLQKAFKNQIQIILISDRETMPKANAFLKAFKNQEIKAAIEGFPKIYNDNRWTQYFPYRSVPHHVWIGEDGKVVAITNGFNTNKKNIADYLAGQVNKMQLKDDFLYDKFSDLILKTSVFKPTYSSAFYPLIPNLTKDLFLVDSLKGEFSRRIALNTINSMAEHFYFPSPIYGLKLPKFMGYGLSVWGGRRIIYEGGVMSKLFRPRDKSFYNQWQRDNMFSYEITLPLTAKSMVPEIAKSDINNYALIKYNVEISEREIETECYVIKFNDISRLKSKYEELTDGVDIVSDTLLKVLNMPFENIYSKLCFLLENRKPIYISKIPNDHKSVLNLPQGFADLSGLPSRPVVFENETSKGKFDLEIRGNLRNYKELKGLLASKGINLSIKKKPVKYLSFRDLSE